MAVVSIKNKLRRGNLLVGNEAYDPGAFVSIATITVGSGGASNVEFTSIPSTYTHLQIRCISYAGNGSYLRMQFNGDTASNYSWHALYGNGSSVIIDSATNADSIANPSQSNDSNTLIKSPIIIDILEYKNTNIYKTVRSIGGKDRNGSGNIGIHSGNWRNTNAITSIKLYGSGVNFAQYDHFALYGIKVAS